MISIRSGCDIIVDDEHGADVEEHGHAEDAEAHPATSDTSTITVA